MVYGVQCVLVNQKRGGTTWRSNVYRLLVPREQAPRAQYPLTITSNSRVARPPYKNARRLQKYRKSMRVVDLFLNRVQR